MYATRLIIAVLLIIPASAAAAPERPAPMSESMRQGLAGLAAWEAAGSPTVVLPRISRRPVPRADPPTTGLAGLAAWEAAASWHPAPPTRATQNSGLRGDARHRFQPASFLPMGRRPLWRH